MRRILIILILLGLAGGAVWYFTIRPKSNNQTEEQASGFKSFFSFGDNNSETGPDGNQIPITENTLETPQNTNSQFKQITPISTAGYTIFSETKKVSIPPASPKEKPTLQTITDYFVRYVSRQNGFVYEIKNEIAPLQISNIFIPVIYEAYFADNNTTAILRFLKEGTNTIGTYSVPIPNENPDGTRTQKEGVFLSDNILGLNISSDTKEIFSLTREQTQGVFVSSSSFGKNKKELLRSPLKEWVISSAQKNNLYAQTKSAGTVDGFFYKIDAQEKRLRRILGDIKGLTTSISPSGNLVLYSETTNNGFVTKILNIKTGSIKNTNLSILPEKCTWLKNEDLICAGNTDIPEGTYPDVWYAGLISFSDQLFRIYTESNTFDVIYNGNEKSFDMTYLQIDEDRNLLFFIDKNTGFLWSFIL